MQSGKIVLWSFVAAVPLLGLGWYGISSECCWPGCCEANASPAAESKPVAKVTPDCCPEGCCCPECCLTCCPEETAKAPAVKTEAKEAAGDCCSGGSCCTPSALGAKKPSAVKNSKTVCPPCPFCP
jgi:hypothetical protein